ncbi:D-Ala-D-Ala carboxypeptidase family metallohydrolase [Prevotella heparinolytica]|uniref:D-Ala-D-Ala carboxypeptidase family metallohydrolase n=1 Tax=Prevotella heparinolytica TaxID=28113 RepID=UPI0010412B6A|nr:D-Ala-D-Ala carboxypeptidase family metallohydrolase [Bacteroides heparinolyticus]
MKYFTIPELCASRVAAACGVDNTPSVEVESNLRRLVAAVLDPAREFIGVPILVNSGYRCHLLNAMVGGSATSQHLYGYAADITCRYECLPQLFHYIRDVLTFDQLIYYRSQDFIHVSYVSTRTNRKEVIIKA